MYKELKLSPIKKIFIYISLLLFIAGSLLGYSYYVIDKNTRERIRRGAIDSVIASESPVYFDDGKSLIGVFFEKTHRKYLPYNKIPKKFVDALIASEDRTFFEHKGFNPKSFIRALIANIKAGRVVQGGSTLTQQTAKNIFKREKRSYKAKLKELIQAFLLERRYSKEDIFEMYANQFFVNGYGKGLAIAAQYFFDKDVQELNLIETAFIAGSVKGPNMYNPFIKKTEMEKKRTIEHANRRKNYVLSNMYRSGFITQKQYIEARNGSVPFKEGKITYKLNVILDYVREQLESPYFSDILREEGIENIATSGIRIYTSINKDIQEGALKSLRRRLQSMDVSLAGYSRGIPKKFKGLIELDARERDNGMPFYARVAKVISRGKNPYIEVEWRGNKGVISYEGLKPMGEAWLKWKLGRWAVFSKRHIASFLKNIHEGDMAPIVRRRYQDIASGELIDRLELAKIPELDGGVIVFHNGMVKAMAGGFLNRFFNRSVDAKRQLGSIFKPIVYAAALQLKWNTLDALDNTRDLFLFENVQYFPRPDHTPKSNIVSMVLAGANSENLASVWLLYHLTDRLTLSEFKDLTSIVGLNRKQDESYEAYKSRIRDTLGVVVNRRALREAAFEVAKKELESDIIFAGHEDVLDSLKNIHFSINSNNMTIKGKEKERILRYVYKNLYSINIEMKNRFKKIAQYIKTNAENGTDYEPDMAKIFDDFYLYKEEEGPEKVFYTKRPHLFNRRFLKKIKAEWFIKREEPFSYSNIFVDGLIPSFIIDELQTAIQKNFDRLLSLKRYSPEVLYRIRDFKTIVNLFYIVLLSQKMGFTSNLAPVLSFPLGPNAVSIAEAALAYQAVMSGKTYPVGENTDLAMLPVITKIEDRDGAVIWRYNKKPREVLSKRVSASVTEILKKVTEVGTAKRARDAVTLSGVPLPIFGKTGTSNSFRNSSFLGFIPGPDTKKRGLNIDKGYVIAAYVGYDDNRPMKGKHVTIYGSSGALPVWIDTANTIVKSQDFEGAADPADIAFGSIVNPYMLQSDEFQPVAVSAVTGLPIDKMGYNDVDIPIFDVVSQVKKDGHIIELLRRFEPIRN